MVCYSAVVFTEQPAGPLLMSWRRSGRMTGRGRGGRRWGSAGRGASGPGGSG